MSVLKSTTASIRSAATMSAPRLPRWLPFAIVVAAMAPITVFWWQLIASGSVAFDWRIFVQAGERFWAGSPDLYEVNDLYSFRHSPLFAMAMPVIGVIGTLGIRVVTIIAALALPTWPMRLLVLASWPFAMDVQQGALITVITLAAAWALSGSRAASIAFIVLALLSPRPLMIPIAAYLLWSQPWLRLPSLALLVLSGAAVLATGYADEWAHILLFVSGDAFDSPFNLAPSRVIGAAWMPIALAAAALLTWRRHVGLAAVVANPYVLPHYLLLAILELLPRRSA
jgi:hypothetical protein